MNKPTWMSDPTIAHIPQEKLDFLSQMFEKVKGKEASLECTAIMLNINYGHNRKLMEKCKRLEEYAIFIATIRKYQKAYG